MFRDGYVCPNKDGFMKAQAKEFVLAFNANGSVSAEHNKREERLIAWRRPQAAGCVKLNTDGSVNHSLGLATVRGFIRNEDGRWCHGFVHNIGSCTVPRAKLWGVAMGLQLAWDLGYRRVEVDMDS